MAKSQYSRLLSVLLLWLLYIDFVASFFPGFLPPADAPAPNADIAAPSQPAPAAPDTPLPVPPPPSSSAQPAEAAPSSSMESPKFESSSSSGGLNGGQKAGVAIASLAGAGLLFCRGMVYMKRRSNIRRARFSREAGRPVL